MRHNKSINHLSRKSGHRKALLANMAVSLIEHKRITTTLAKAKALKMYVEPLVTKSKEDTTHSRRTVFSYLKNKEAVKELFGTISPKIMSRPGGYTRILKVGFRQGDAAEMALIEFVDFNEAALASSPKKEAKKTSTRRSRSKKAAAPAAEAAAERKRNNHSPYWKGDDPKGIVPLLELDIRDMTPSGVRIRKRASLTFDPPSFFLPRGRLRPQFPIAENGKND